MEQNDSISLVGEIMADFADLTGLTSERPPQRYLWTDAFGVCNFIELYTRTKETGYLDLALRLVDQVQHVLGRHREKDPRTGWISGLDDKEGARHPTQGGLRIGKKLGERKPDEPLDQRLEWDRDGQYYHYLTKWMHALYRVSRVSGDTVYHRWALELAQTAHAAFAYTPSSGGHRRMHWKMSIDLSYPLVPSMGQHDPLDGLITYRELQAKIPQETGATGWPDLRQEVADMAAIGEGKSWATDDPLGLGGLLADAYRVAQMLVGGVFDGTDLLDRLLTSALVSLPSYVRKDELKLPALYRLAFRELGLSLGLRAARRLQRLVIDHPTAFNLRGGLGAQIDDLMDYTPLGGEIERFWLTPDNREAESWQSHRAINMVSLATSLVPDGYLAL
jgi:hypothetical protein